MNSRKSDADGLPARLPERLRHAWMPYVVLMLAVLLAYANVYRNDFLYDDTWLITENRFLTSWHYIGTLFVTSITQGYGIRSHDPFYRPLQMLLYMVVFRMAGASTIAFHIPNLALHALNACLLYALGLRLGFRRMAAFLAALLWAVHPVQTEAVTYMSGTADPLCGAFLLGGIYVLAARFSPRRVLVSCVLFALALLSKETAVVFPLLAMGLLFYQSENRGSPRTYLKTWPFWLMTALYLLARETVLNFGDLMGAYDSNGAIDAATLPERLYTFLATLPVYVKLLVWPSGLHMERSTAIYTSLSAPEVLSGLAILAVSFVGVIWKPGRRATPLAWGILWAAALHIPQSNILTIINAPICEHWLYLPMAGLALGLSETVARSAGYFRTKYLQPVLCVLALMAAGLLGFMTFQQNEIWRDPIVFFHHIIDCGGDSFRVRFNLGRSYADEGLNEAAIREYLLALKMMDNSEANFFLGAAVVNLYHDDPELRDEGIKHFEHALELDPDYYQAADALAHVYQYIGDREKEDEYRAMSAAIRKKFGIE